MMISAEFSSYALVLKKIINTTALTMNSIVYRHTVPLHSEVYIHGHSLWKESGYQTYPICAKQLWCQEVLI